jgi:hypothetical protein
MRDEMDARIWVEHHEDFSNGIASLLASIGNAFRRLQNIRFDAPWKREDVERPGQA